MNTNLKTLLIGAASAFALTAAAVAQTVTPMEEVETRRFDSVHRISDLDLSQYEAVYIGPVTVSYADRHPDYVLNGAELDRLNDLVRQELAEALAGDGDYQLVDERGPGVLDIRAALIETRINASDRSPVTNSRTYARSVGEFTLQAVIKDGETGANLILFEDEYRGRDTGMRWVTSLTYWAEARRAFSRWSEGLVDVLDRHHEDAGAE